MVSQRAKLGRAAMKALRARNIDAEVERDLALMITAFGDTTHPRHRAARLETKLFSTLHNKAPEPADGPRLAHAHQWLTALRVSGVENQRHLAR